MSRAFGSRCTSAEETVSGHLQPYTAARRVERTKDVFASLDITVDVSCSLLRFKCETILGGHVEVQGEIGASKVATTMMWTCVDLVRRDPRDWRSHFLVVDG